MSATAWLVRDGIFIRMSLLKTSLGRAFRQRYKLLLAQAIGQLLECLVSDSVWSMADESGAQRAAAATEVRRGVISLARRLRLERNEVGLTALELSILGHLHRRGPLTPGELATAERVQPQSLTRTLAALEEARLVSRQPDPADGRRSLLAITESGHAALRTEMEQRDAWLAAAMAEELTTTEIGLLRLAGSILERLADAPEP
jgi:DNA-binding MarR family transcriptional regulator